MFNGRVIGLESSLDKPENPSFIIFQVIGKLPFELDIVFESDSHIDRYESLVGQRYTDALSDWMDTFDLRFEKTFYLQQKGFNDTAVRCVGTFAYLILDMSITQGIHGFIAQMTIAWLEQLPLFCHYLK